MRPNHIQFIPVLPEPAPTIPHSLFAAYQLIFAIIRPGALKNVRIALVECDVYLMTVSEVQGFGRQRGVTEVYRTQGVEERLLPKLKLEIALSDAFVEDATEAIVRGVRSGTTGSVGDGKVFVIPLDGVIRIRTGETGENALGP